MGAGQRRARASAAVRIVIEYARPAAAMDCRCSTKITRRAVARCGGAERRGARAPPQVLTRLGSSSPEPPHGWVPGVVQALPQGRAGHARARATLRVRARVKGAPRHCSGYRWQGRRRHQRAWPGILGRKTGIAGREPARRSGHAAQAAPHALASSLRTPLSPRRWKPSRHAAADGVGVGRHQARGPGGAARKLEPASGGRPQKRQTPEAHCFRGHSSIGDYSPRIYLPLRARKDSNLRPSVP